MPSRRAHKKSRYGCSECKLRKRKCDEVHPICANCIRVGLVCFYPIRPHSTSPASSTVSEPTPLLSPSENGCTIDQPTFDMMDLTLMNHFTAVTSFSLFGGEQKSDLWQRDIPFEARSSPLLMHGLLSVTSFHLAIKEPQDMSAYRMRALHHHDLGLRLFKDQLSYVSEANCHILFAFALLLVMWVYASPTVTNEDLRLDDILDLLDLVRGCKTIFLLQKESIVNKPIGQFLEMHKAPEMYKSDLPPCINQIFESLRSLAVDAKYLQAINKLQVYLENSTKRPKDTTIAVAWPAIVQDSYWTDLRNHNPLAILVFAHYAMLLQCYEGHCWWMSGWSERMLKAAGSELSDTDKESLNWETCLSHIQQAAEIMEEWRKIHSNSSILLESPDNGGWDAGTVKFNESFVR